MDRWHGPHALHAPWPLPCRKHKSVHKAPGMDEKRLQATLKRLGVNPIPGIEEVLMVQHDGSALQFANPKVQAAFPGNTYVISGTPQLKSATEVKASMAPDLGELTQLLSGAGNLPSFDPEGAAVEPEDDDVPELVGDFEEKAAVEEKTA